MALSHVHDSAKRPLGDSLLEGGSNVLLDVAVAVPWGHCRPGLPGLPHLIEHIVVALGIGNQVDWMGLTTPTTTTIRTSVDASPAKLDGLVRDLARLCDASVCGRDVIRVAREQAVEVREELESLNKEQGSLAALLRQHWQAIADREREGDAAELSGMAHLSVGRYEELLRCVDEAEAWLDHADDSSLPLPLLFQQLHLVVNEGVFGARARWTVTPAATPIEVTFEQEAAPRRSAQPRPTRGRRRSQLFPSAESSPEAAKARRSDQEARNTSLVAEWLAGALARYAPPTTAARQAGSCLVEPGADGDGTWAGRRTTGSRGAALAQWTRLEATRRGKQASASRGAFVAISDHGVRGGEVGVSWRCGNPSTALVSAWVPLSPAARSSGDSAARNRALAWHATHSQRLPVWGEVVTATARFVKGSPAALPDTDLGHRQGPPTPLFGDQGLPRIIMEPMVAPDPGYLAVLRLDIGPKRTSEICSSATLSEEAKASLLREAAAASQSVFSGVLSEEGRVQLMLQAAGELCGMAGLHVFPRDASNPIMSEEAVSRLQTALAGATLSSLGFPDSGISPDVRAYRALVASAVVRATTGRVAAAEAVAQACAQADALGDAEGFVKGLLDEVPEYWSLEDGALDSLLDARVDAMQEVIRQVQGALSDPESVQLDLYMSGEPA